MLCPGGNPAQHLPVWDQYTSPGTEKQDALGPIFLVMTYF